MGDLFNSILYPIELIVAWIMYGWYKLLLLFGMPAASGWTWSLSIVGLVVVMRAAMIPLFVKQIKASRKMQLIQPELQKIQKKYKGKSDPESRQALTQETMQLYRKEGTNPFSSCLPILVQSPFFFGLFRVLNGLQSIADGSKEPIGPITRELASSAESASIFGAQLSAKFVGAETLNVKVITILLIVLMSLSTFTTQRQLMMKNMPASALDNPFAKQQKIMLYVIPFFFFISGPNFPIGVLVYWLTTNIWSMVQQFYVIRRMPAPGSEAEKALHRRLERRGKPIPGAVKPALAEGVDESGASEAPAAARQSGQRQQPKGKKRAKGRNAPGGAPGSASPQGPDSASGEAAGPDAATGSHVGPSQPGNASQSVGSQPSSAGGKSGASGKSGGRPPGGKTPGTSGGPGAGAPGSGRRKKKPPRKPRNPR